MAILYPLKPKEVAMLQEANRALMATPEFKVFVARVDTLRTVYDLPPTAQLDPQGLNFIGPDSIKAEI